MQVKMLLPLRPIQPVVFNTLLKSVFQATKNIYASENAAAFEANPISSVQHFIAKCEMLCAALFPGSWHLIDH